MNKINYLKKEISYVKDANRRKDLRILIGLLPDYFFEIPASSTGKYHPEFAAGEGGLLRHTKVAVRIAHELLENNTVGWKFSNEDKDLMIMALTLHDGLKCGLPKEKYTKFDHPLLVSKYIMENKDKVSIKIDDLRKMCSLIESHMGEWNYDKFSKKEVLPKPRTAEQRFVHMCDYLASRKFIDVKFNDNNDIKY